MQGWMSRCLVMRLGLSAFMSVVCLAAPCRRLSCPRPLSLAPRHPHTRSGIFREDTPLAGVAVIATLRVVASGAAEG